MVNITSMAEIQIKIKDDELLLQKDFKVDAYGKLYLGKEFANQEVFVIVLKKRKPVESQKV